MPQTNPLLGMLLGGGIQALFGIGNNLWAEEAQHQGRLENYELGEQSAQNADARTRALYRDIYSPQALMKQYKVAGLSPSMMYGGTPGQGGMSGAQGTGAAGPGTPYMPVSMIEGAQLANLNAQTKKIEAETENISTETQRAKIAKDVEALRKDQFSNEWTLLNVTMHKEDGTPTSMYETAQNSWEYEDFVKKIREAAEKSERRDILDFASTENGQKILRSIYMNANRFDHDIQVLSSEKTSAEFQEEVVRAMKGTNFADLNAKSAVQWLEAQVQTNMLNETQRKAWNNLLSRLGNGTTRDIIIVLGMIFDRAMTQYHMPSIVNKTYNNTKTTNTYEL